MLSAGTPKRHLGRRTSRLVLTAVPVVLVSVGVLALAAKLGLLGGSAAVPHAAARGTAIVARGAPAAVGGRAHVVVRRRRPRRSRAPATKPLGSGRVSFVAQVRGRSIAIFRRPGGVLPSHVLANPNPDGAPLVFLAKARQGAWLEVYLPIRPNLSTGWIRAAEVTLVSDPYRVQVNLPEHRVTVWRTAGVIFGAAVGVGHAVTPTPAGRYFITELLAQPDPHGVYGPYAFGLSAHSDVLHEFDGADGEIGLHGTDSPQGIGSDVSHGCIRMNNPGITRLARLLPLGTPVTIVG